MKRIITLTLFIMLAVMAFAQTPTRGVQQVLQLDPSQGDIRDYVTNTLNTHSEHYIFRVLHVESDVVRGTDMGYNPNVIKIAKIGNDTVGWTVSAIFNQSMWPAVWPAGSHVKMMFWHVDTTGPGSGVEPYPQYDYVEKTFEVPPGGGLIRFYLPEDHLIVPGPTATSY